MGSQYSCFIIVYLLSFLFSILIVHPIPICSASADLIEETCKKTKYYDLCVSSLKWDPTSPRADAKGLAVIMVKVAMANATATKAYLQPSPQMVKQNETSRWRAMKECADRYAFASDALNSSVQELSDEMYDYAYMHVMAAADYPNACRNAFKARLPGLVFPPEIALRGDALKRICDVVLGIIDALAFT